VEVFAVSVLVESVIGMISDVGLATEPYTVDPASLVISMSERDCAVVVAVVTVTDWMTSVPVFVVIVKVLEVVADPPGAKLPPTGSLPLPSVTILSPGDTGSSATPVDQLPVVSCTNILK
jgi:hypothetical protein